jgi:predicted ATPase
VIVVRDLVRMQRTLQRLELTNFKGFERFVLDVGGRDCFLVGPNNAGKSTLLASARVTARVVRIANRQRADAALVVDDVSRQGHIFDAVQVDLQDENLRYEFEQRDSSIRAVFAPDTSVNAYWQVVDGPLEGFAYLLDGDFELARPSDVKQAVPVVGIVPILSPLEQTERLLSDKQVSANLDTRLASRHFRNQVFRLDEGSQAAFDALVKRWAPEVTLTPVQVHGAGDGLDLYFEEPGGRLPKEICWAGDGIQIWLQLLLHLARHREADVVLLDEPEVFLHADLQRRLVRVLDEHPAQIVMATHSSEVLMEAPDESIVWIQRTRRSSLRIANRALQRQLNAALGSGFNLDVARTLKAERVCFVEGNDLGVLRRLAGTVGAQSLAEDSTTAVLKLRGSDRWDRTEPFAWLAGELLGHRIPVAVLLDRDFRDDDETANLQKRLIATGVDGHVWRRHELESYLIEIPAIARVSGGGEDAIADLLQNAVAELRDEMEVGTANWWVKTRRYPAEQAFRKAKQEVAEVIERGEALQRFPGKELRKALNRRLQAKGLKTLTNNALADALTADEIAPEMRGVLKGLGS